MKRKFGNYSLYLICLSIIWLSLGCSEDSGNPLVPNGGWIKLTINGQTTTLKKNVQAGKFGDFSFGVSGEDEASGLDLAIAVVTKGDPAKPGSYPFGLLEKGTAVVDLKDSGRTWGSSYYDCSTMTGVSSSGSVNFTTWSDKKGDSIKGGFSAKLYEMVSECDKESITVTVEFEVPRSE